VHGDFQNAEESGDSPCTRTIGPKDRVSRSLQRGRNASRLRTCFGRLSHAFGGLRHRHRSLRLERRAQNLCERFRAQRECPSAFHVNSAALGGSDASAALAIAALASSSLRQTSFADIAGGRAGPRPHRPSRGPEGATAQPSDPLLPRGIPARIGAQQLQLVRVRVSNCSALAGLSPEGSPRSGAAQ
jgi:hypothetical protein